LVFFPPSLPHSSLLVALREGGREEGLVFGGRMTVTGCEGRKGGREGGRKGGRGMKTRYG